MKRIGSFGVVAGLIMVGVPTLWAGAAFAAPATWFVAKTGNNSNNCSAAATPCLTITGALGKAAAGDTISVAAGTYTENLVVTKGVKIISSASPVVIDGNHASYAVATAIPAGQTFEMDNLTIQNGTAPSSLSFGGGLLIEDGANVLNSVVVLGNTAADGGGVAVIGDSFSTTDPGSLTGANDVFSNNSSTASATGSGGGALYVTGHVALTNSSFIGNSAALEGGGIELVRIVAADTPSVSLTNTTFTSNNHALIGGAIAQSQFSTALGGATTLAMTGGKIDSSTALSGAGLYVIEGATATLDGTTVSNNVANGSTNANFGNGGGIFNSGHLTIKDSANTGNSQLLGNKVVADTAAPPGFTGTGGAIINDSSTATPTLTISNTIVGGTTTAAANNGNLGAGIANIAPAQTTATSVKVEGNTGVEGVGLYGGGTVSLTGSSISNNAATFEGGGFFETPISTSDHPSFTLNGTSLGSNTATTAAGGGLVNVLSTFSMTGGSIANNLSAEGGGLFVIGKGASSTAGVATLDGTLVTNNTATAAANEGNGGAIFNAGTVTIKDSANTGNSVITGNRATAGTSGVTGYGGAIFNGPFTPGDAPSLTITGTSLGSTSAPNSATFGGAIANVGNVFGLGAPAPTPGRLNVSGGTLTSNSATSEGGAIYDGGSATVGSASTTTTFTANTAAFAGGTWFVGSTVAADAPSLTAVSVNVTGSSATVGLGGDAYVSASSTLAMTNGSLNGGTANDGGGLVVAGGGTANLTGTSLQNNSSVGNASVNTGDGGAILNVGTLTLTNATVSGNKATVDTATGSPNVTGEGGAIFAGAATGTVTAKTTLVGDTLSGNTASAGAAVVSFASAGTNPTSISNSTIANNTSSSVFGAIVPIDPMSIVSSTIAGNTAASGGGGAIVAFANGVASLSGSIISGNTAGSATTNCVATVTDGGYNLTDPGDPSCGLSTAKHDILANPQLGALANNGGPTQTELPGASSPAINVIPPTTTTGINDAVNGSAITLCASASTDQRGVTRPSGPTCDIGSVEVNTVAPTLSGPAAATYSVGSAGATQTFTSTGTPTPTITETGPLPTGVTFTQANGTATISGTPGQGTAGTYPIVVTASNGSAPNATINFTLTVTQPPLINGPSSDTFTVGTPGSDTFTATASPTATLSATGALPAGVTFVDNHDDTATLSGTPQAGSGGTYPLMIRASNGVGSDGTMNFVLTVDEAAGVSGPASDTFTVGTTVTNGDVFTATGFPTPTISSSLLPPGVTLTSNGNGTATLGGTPTAGAGGSYTITITAHNGVGTDPQTTIQLTINEAPTLTGPTAQGFQTGVNGSATYTAGGFPQPSLSESGPLPAGVMFVDNHNGTGTLAGTPAASTGGVYVIAVTATNGIGTDATVKTTVTVGQAPGINGPSTATFTVGSAAPPQTFTTTGFPQPTLSTTALPSGVTFTDNHNGTGTLAGTPDAGTGRVYDITVTATNGVGADAQTTIQLTIDEAPSVSGPSTATFTVGVDATPQKYTTGGFPVPTLKTTSTLPTGVTFTDNGDGTATIGGHPAPGTGGTSSIVIVATNGIGSDATTTLNLTIDEAPAITGPSSALFVTNSAGSVGFGTTGFPTASLATSSVLPSGVMFIDHGNGTATLGGTPAANTGGVYPIKITATNGTAPDASFNFTLTVDQPAALMGPTSDTFTVGTHGSDLFTTTGTPTASLTESGTLPNGVTFTDNGNGTGTLAGTPAANTGGVYTFRITATNGVEAPAHIDFTLTVDQAPTVAGPASARFPIGQAGSASFTSTGFPTPAMTEIGPLPSGVTLHDNGNGTATLAGTPADGTDGTYPITIVADNGVAPHATLSFTLQVTVPVTITTTSLVDGSVGVAYAATLAATGGTTPYTWKITSGSLPSGLTLTSAGAISGTPTTAGSSTFTVQVSDAMKPPQTATGTLTLVIHPGPTTLTVAPVLVTTNPPLHITLGFAVATLTGGSPGKPLAGQTIVFTAGGTTLCTLKTVANGTATCAIPPADYAAVLLNLGVTATYAGSPNWSPASGAAGLIN